MTLTFNSMKQRILIIDDKIENLYLLQSMLDSDGFETFSARNGAEALGLMRKDIPDLIIADILMPVMDGFTLCRECKKDKTLKNIPFFFYTATYTDIKDEEYALSLGADKFILKPQEPDVFLKIVSDFMKEVSQYKVPRKKIMEQPEIVVLKEYNEVLVRKIEDKILQTEKSEKELRKYAEELEREIIGHKKSENSLRESQHLFQTLALVSPVGIFRTTPDGKTTYVNPKWSELSGLSPEKALGTGWLTAVHPEDRKALSANWSVNSGSGKESTAEYRFLRPDGSIVWVMGNAVPEQVDNKLVGYIGTITDITERKLTEDRLKSSEERWKILFDYAPDAYYLNDIKGNFVDGNIAAEKLLGYNKKEMIGKNFLKLNLISPGQLPVAAKLLLKNAVGRGTGPDEFVLSRYDGSKITVEIITYPVRIKDQTLVLGIARDITGRKHAEEAMVESEYKYRQLVTQSPDGIFIVDFSGKFLSVNKAICENLKYTEEELLSLKLLDLVPEKYHSMHKERLGTVMNGENTSTSAEYEVIGKDKIIHFVEVLSVPYFHENKLVGFQGIARDITERKSVENLLRESEEKYRRIFENVQDTYYETSIDGTILEVSSSIEVLSKGNYKRSDLIGRSMYDFYPDAIERKTLLEKINENGYVVDFEVTLKNRDGSYIPCSISSKVVLDQKGRPEKILGTLRDITDRRNALIALRESEEMYRSIYDNSSVAILLTSPDGRILSANEYACKLFGRTEEEICKSGRNALVDLSDERLEPLIYERTRTGKATGALTFLRNDGSKFKAEVSSVVFMDRDGNERTSMVIRDLTEQNKAEKLIRDNEARFRSYFDSVVAGIAITSAEKEWIEVNDRLCNMLGYAKDELLASKWSELTHPDDLSIDMNNFDKVLQGEIDAYSIEKRFIRKDGSTLWTNLSVRCAREADGNVDYFIAMIIDITESKKIEEALGESEEKFRSIMENSSDAIFITDIQGKYIYTNLAASELVGFTKSEMLQKSIADVSPKDRINEYFDIFNSIVHKGRIFTEIEIIRKDRTLVPIDINAVKIPGSMIFASCRDISQRKEFEKEMINAKTRAEESDRLKTAFLHNISHEIRTPMNAIVGFSALLGEPGLDEQSKGTFIETITRSSDHLLAIINDIIEISNIEAGILKIHISEVNLKKLFQSLADQYLPKAAEKGLKIIFEVIPDKDTIIETDNTKLLQIITNLLNNALKFTSEGQIGIGYTIIDKQIQFFVSDTGMGIPEDQYERIFDRFYQVEHMMARHFEGTGLGLSISRAFVELMGGKIWVESELNKGSVFYFTLPYNPHIVVASAKPAAKTGIVFSRELTILVAEDNENNLNLLMSYLSNPLLKIIYARNGREAVNICETTQKKIDLVLMDLKMPEMDGYEATVKIKSLFPKLPVIAQTAFVTDKERAFDCGCSEIITKPFKRTELLEIILKYVND
jgi:PAS domain S-box-containing protein